MPHVDDNERKRGIAQFGKDLLGERPRLDSIGIDGVRKVQGVARILIDFLIQFLEFLSAADKKRGGRLSAQEQRQQREPPENDESGRNDQVENQVRLRGYAEERHCEEKECGEYDVEKLDADDAFRQFAAEQCRVLVIEPRDKEDKHPENEQERERNEVASEILLCRDRKSTKREGEPQREIEEDQVPEEKQGSLGFLEADHRCCPSYNKNA